VTAPDQPLIAVPPYAGFPLAQAAIFGIEVMDRDGHGVATLIARKGKSVGLAERLRGKFGIELPHGPRRTIGGEIALIGMGPGVWLAVQEGAGNIFAASLKSAVGDLASVSDQADGYAILRISGPGVREALARLASVDVHPRAFAVGAVASTSAAHIGATLWRLEDRSDGSPVFEIAVPRSLVGSFFHALCEGA
jgi:heterotetrameric sarcosine oxidase gamma subunit